MDELTLAQTIRSKRGPAAIVVENTCRDIKMIARATLNAKGAPGPARRTLLERRLDSLLSSCPLQVKNFQSKPGFVWQSESCGRRGRYSKLDRRGETSQWPRAHPGIQKSGSSTVNSLNHKALSSPCYVLNILVLKTFSPGARYQATPAQPAHVAGTNKHQSTSSCSAPISKKAEHRCYN